jgi:putative endonuclease
VVGRDSTRIRGNRAEQAALDTYLASGARLLARNYRVKCGELDLVLEERPSGRGALEREALAELVIVEVRGRVPGAAWETPAESLTPSKLAKIRAASELFLRDHAFSGGWHSVRFDLAAWDGSAIQIHRNFWWY